MPHRSSAADMVKIVTSTQPVVLRIIGGSSRLDLGELPDLAGDEGLRFVQRTVDEWRSGSNRFDRHGEALLTAHQAERIVGMCGLNIDPFANTPSIGRIRHLYVAPRMRHRGIGRLLVAACLERAEGTFDTVRLRTFDRDAAAFYTAIGFTTFAEPAATHRIAVGTRHRSDDGPPGPRVVDDQAVEQKAHDD